MKAKYYSAILAALIVLYIGLSLLPAPDKHALVQYHLSPLNARILSTTIVLPVIAIWIVAMYGFIKLKEYSELIKKSPDGKAFNTMSLGVLLLAIGSPITAVLSSLSVLLVRQHPSWQPTLTILNNYIGLILMAFGLYYIARGAEQLVALVRKKPSAREQHYLVLLFITLSSFYSYFIITRPIHSELEQRVYYMPNVLILLTLAIPYLYFWYRGLLGAYHLYHYQKHVEGKIYKGSLGWVAAGIATIIVSSILVRLLVTISARINRLSLTPLLLIIYGFLLVAALGYILIAMGAKRLRRIEEV